MLKTYTSPPSRSSSHSSSSTSVHFVLLPYTFRKVVAIWFDWFNCWRGTWTTHRCETWTCPCRHNRNHRTALSRSHRPRQTYARPKHQIMEHRHQRSSYWRLSGEPLLPTASWGSWWWHWGLLVSTLPYRTRWWPPLPCWRFQARVVFDGLVSNFKGPPSPQRRRRGGGGGGEFDKGKYILIWRISLFTILSVLVGLFSSLSLSLEESKSMVSWSMIMIWTSFRWVFSLFCMVGHLKKQKLGLEASVRALYREREGVCFEWGKGKIYTPPKFHFFRVTHHANEEENPTETRSDHNHQPWLHRFWLL